MMDRPIIYAGAVPFDTDLLRLGRYAKEGLGRFAEMLVGSQTIMASGLICQMSDSDLSVTIGRGAIMAPDALDAAHIGGISAGLDADFSATQALFYNDAPQTLTIPLTGVDITLYAVCRVQDDTLDVLPFYNAEKPDQTMAGPDNRGKALPTRRTGRISFAAGVSAPSAAGAIIVPLYVMSIPAGIGTLSSIVPRQSGVFLPALPELATMSFAQQISQPQALCVASQILTIPEWARQVELRVIGGGGGGASSNALTPEVGSFSGGGGGAGGDCWGIYSVDPARNASLSVTVGQGGAAGQRGGPSFVTYDGTPFLTSDGGGSAYFAAAQMALGGDGGGTGGGTLWNQTGGGGSDGQNGTVVFAGNGANGPWGGGGKAGYLLGANATRYGAGGGGAYSTRVAGQTAVGGRGYQGLVIYRFLH
ncbi:hypothetical protein HW517_10315 [Asaia spathodeae]|uniref:glycine-rich domain-containing protein n=1 Tax=Asaia spathodeae TaxID=657016 RepID=UPI002FC351FA